MVKIEFQFPNLKEKLLSHRRDIELVIAASMQTNRGELFDKEGAHNGHPGWAPLAFRSVMILSKRGTLRKSIGPQNAMGQPGPGGIVEIQENMVTIGTKLAYARLMNDGTTKLPGGVLRPVNAKALKIPIPEGKAANETAKGIRKANRAKGKDPGFIFRKSVRIPARPFDQLNAKDAEEIEATVSAKIMEILNG